MLELEERIAVDHVARAAAKRLGSIGISLPDVQSVTSYITAHPDTGPLLEQLASKLSVSFGNSADVTLEVYCDPEIDDRYLTFYLRKPDLSPSDLELIDHISEEFSPGLATTSGWVVVIPDFRPSR